MTHLPFQNPKIDTFKDFHVTPSLKIGGSGWLRSTVKGLTDPRSTIELQTHKLIQLVLQVAAHEANQFPDPLPSPLDRRPLLLSWGER